MTDDPVEPAYPIWEVSAISGSDALLIARSNETLRKLRALVPDKFVDALSDPRRLHEELFVHLTPDDCPEYAGNYRGSAHPSLASRNLSVHPDIERIVGKSRFATPEQVAQLMDTFRQVVQKYANKFINDKDQAALGFAGVFRYFGRFHPFLDGNGHVQRIIFQALVERSGNKVREPFVHPRPYDVAMARALATDDNNEISRELRKFIL